MSMVALANVSMALPDPSVVVQQSAEIREVVRCGRCRLVQYPTVSGSCRRCHHWLGSATGLSPAGMDRGASVLAAKDYAPGVAYAVKQFRTFRHLTQKKLAARIGVPKTYVSKMERGKVVPVLDTLQRVAAALDVPLFLLMYCIEGAPWERAMVMMELQAVPGLVPTDADVETILCFRRTTSHLREELFACLGLTFRREVA